MRLGIGVSGDLLTAVAVNGRRLLWAGAYPLEQVSDLAAALSSLAGELPRRPGRVSVALESDICQVRVVEGLPPVSDAKLNALVATQSGRWFLKNGDPLVTVARKLPSGRVLIAGVGGSLLDDTAGAVTAAGFKTPELIPASDLIGAVADDGNWVRQLGTFAETLAVQGGAVSSIRRGHMNGVPPFVPEQLKGIECDVPASRLTSAWAGATGHSNLVFRSSGYDRLRQRGHMKKLGVGVAAAALMFATSASTYVHRLSRAREGANAALAEMGADLSTAVRLQNDLDLNDQALGTIRTALENRSDDARLLAGLTSALPDSVYLVSLRRSGNRVTMAGVAPSAAVVVALLERVEEFASPRLDGPVTRQTGADGVRERFGLTFQWSGRVD